MDEYQSQRLPVPRHVANVRSDTRAVLDVIGEGCEPLQNRAAFAFCAAIMDSGQAHYLEECDPRWVIEKSRADSALTGRTTRNRDEAHHVVAMSVRLVAARRSGGST